MEIIIKYQNFLQHISLLNSCLASTSHAQTGFFCKFVGPSPLIQSKFRDKTTEKRRLPKIDEGIKSAAALDLKLNALVWLMNVKNLCQVEELPRSLEESVSLIFIIRLLQMKGGKDFRLSSLHLSVILIIFLFTAILLRDMGKYAIFTSKFSTPDQPEIPSSSALRAAPNNSSVYINPVGQVGEIDSGSFGKEEINNDVPPEESGASSPLQMEECNYGKGKWVADRGRPLYSGRGCTWIGEKYRCRVTTRRDFSFEGYRWQLFDCDIPEFDPSAFLRRMQGKTIAFIGDSLGREQFQSLMCMCSSGEDSSEVEDVASEYGLVKDPDETWNSGSAYRFRNTNTTILHFWSPSLSYIDGFVITDPKSKVSVHLDRPPTFLQQNIHRFDVLVLNTAHHWNLKRFKKNHWVMHLNGTPINTDSELAEYENARNFKVQSIIKWLHSQILLYPGLKAFFRTISPRHFFNGDWNTHGTCDNTTPLSRGSEVLQDGSSDRVVEAAVNGTQVKILDVTALSDLRDEAHKSNYHLEGTSKKYRYYDCLHWCLPGVPDTWNELLVAQL